MVRNTTMVINHKLRKIFEEAFVSYFYTRAWRKCKNYGNFWIAGANAGQTTSPADFILLLVVMYLDEDTVSIVWKSSEHQKIFSVSENRLRRQTDRKKTHIPAE